MVATAQKAQKHSTGSFACCCITKLLGCELKARVVFTAGFTKDISKTCGKYWTGIFCTRCIDNLFKHAGGIQRPTFRTIFRGTLIERQDHSRLTVHEKSSASNHCVRFNSILSFFFLLELVHHENDASLKLNDACAFLLTTDCAFLG